MASNTHNGNWHPEDDLLAAAIASAKEFTAYYRNGPLDKIVERGFTSYDDARVAADRLETTHSRFGRKALVYAISDKGYTIPCTPEAIARAAAVAL